MDDIIVKRLVNMGKIVNIKKQTDNNFLNLYEMENIHKNGRHGRYFFASRLKSVDELKLNTKKNNPDGVIIYALTGENKDKLVLIRQYRYTIDDYIYEFPAGLVEDGEDYEVAAKREIFEETGMEFKKIEVPEGFESPFFTSIGMSDEACATVFGYCEGEISTKNLEDSEEIEVVIADKKVAREILRNGKIAIMTAYMLMHFINSEDPFYFLKEE